MAASSIVRMYFDGPGRYIVGYLIDNEYVKEVIIYADNCKEFIEKWMKQAKEVLNIKVNDLSYIEKIKL